MMLEFADIQHILLTRTPAMTGRYEFLTFGNPAGAQAWLSEVWLSEGVVRGGCPRCLVSGHRNSVSQDIRIG